MNDTHKIIEGESLRCANNYHPLPVVLSKGLGVWLWDVEDNQYLDMMSAYSAVSHGHSNPILLEALINQASTLAVTSRAFHTDKLYPFLDKVCELSGLDKALPMNTGAEAVETAIKAARRWGYQVKGIAPNQAEILVCEDNFHGRTVTITSFSTDDEYQKDFGPFTPGFKPVAYGDIGALKAAITPNTCAFLVEVMQGEAGIQIPPQGWLHEVSKLCKENNVLLIVDEIQTGLARTGKMFAFQHEGIVPDGLILGKALGGGIYPVSAFVGRKDLIDVFNPGSHGSTFGGNPLACAVALSSLELLVQDNMAENSKQLGDYLMDELRKIKSPYIKDIRGKGLWIGVEIDTSKISAREVCEKLMRNQVLTKEAHDTVIRFAPPLVITKEQIDWGLARIKDAFEQLAMAA